ncbi:MAG: NADH-quinone oxidoreductase subunit J [Planctomycetes bacterium]|nr:NADH-quinone oxidoreductase subunit J [Planctomycetota bacterium]
MDSVAQPILFWIIATATATCAIAVVVSQNIVRAATWLLFSLGGTAGIFFLLGADLVGATQILVYVGGTLILLVFGVMLTAQGPFITMKTGAAEWVISAVVGLLFFGVLAVTAFSVGSVAAKNDGRLEPPGRTVKEYAPKLNLVEASKSASSSAILGQGFLGVGVGPAHLNAKGKPERANYLLPFEIVSVHLLVVLIGAAYLARAKRRRRGTA